MAEVDVWDAKRQAWTKGKKEVERIVQEHKMDPGASLPPLDREVVLPPARLGEPQIWPRR